MPSTSVASRKARRLQWTFRESTSLLKAWILGSGGWMPTAARATACTLIRERERALAIDLGTGAHRLVTDSALLDGAKQLDVLLTHFHLDHVCGLTYLPALSLPTTVWAPGRWLYGTSSSELLAGLRTPPLSAFTIDELPSPRELEKGKQMIGGFRVRARAQPHHWATTAGYNIDNAVALITDTGYDGGSVELARGVRHLLHEAWSPSTAPLSPANDATGADAGRVAAEAGAEQLTLIHLNPLLDDHQPVVADARQFFAAAELGKDGLELRL
jgi:ribonuclease BN (tRNA processing enzyme)